VAPRRPAGRAVGRPQCRCPLLRCRLPHAGQTIERRRRAGDAGRCAAGRAAPAISYGLLQEASAAGRTRLAAENPGAGGALETVLSDGRRRHPQRDPQGLHRLRRGARAGRGAPPGRRLGESEIHGYARERKFEETAIALSLLSGVEMDVSSARCSISPMRWCSSSPSLPACPRPPSRRSCCSRPAIAACPRRTSDRALTSFGQLAGRDGAPRAGLLSHHARRARRGLPPWR